MADFMTQVMNGKVVDEYSSQPTKKSNDYLGKEDFLKLLVAQMQYQDPLEPQADTQFIAQLAQFSSLEQMQNMNATMMNTQAFNLLGKEVVVSTDYGNVQGYVDYVTMQNNKAYLSIDGNLYSVDKLVRVLDLAYSIGKYLPTVEASELEFNRESPGDVQIKLSFGEEPYKANGVAVGINGSPIDKEYLRYGDGVLTISKEAFAGLDSGKYTLVFYFDDPMSSTITDKVTINVKGDKPATEENDSTPKEDDAGADD